MTVHIKQIILYNKKYKKLIMVDLDGVLNTYNGKYDADYIPPIKDGAKDFLTKLHKEYALKIFTTRQSLLVKKWAAENGIEDFILGITNIKEPAVLFIDDRALQFNGNYEETLNEINNFKVWYIPNHC